MEIFIRQDLIPWPHNGKETQETVISQGTLWPQKSWSLLVRIWNNPLAVSAYYRVISCPGRMRLVRAAGSQMGAEGSAAAEFLALCPGVLLLGCHHSPLSQPSVLFDQLATTVCLLPEESCSAPHHQPLSIPSTSSLQVASLTSYVAFPVFLYTNTVYVG